MSLWLRCQSRCSRAFCLNASKYALTRRVDGQSNLAPSLCSARSCRRGARLTVPVNGAQIWTRGAKTRSSITIPSLPQGALPQGAPVVVDEDDGPAYPTVIQQARNNMNKFSHCVVLTRVGSFYELYFDQAKEFGPLLNIKVGKKNTNAGPVAMAGFPFFQLDRFLKILVQDLNKHVAISEEYANDPESKAKLMHDRRVSRIITPGTLIDEKFMDPFENNYLLSVQCDMGHASETEENRNLPATNSPEVGLAWLDLSSGDFFTQRTNLNGLGAVVARIAPREILVDTALQDVDDARLTNLTRDDLHIITYVESQKGAATPNDWLSLMEDGGKCKDTSNFSPLEVAAGNAILQYINKNLLGKKPQLLAPLQRQDDEYMALDKNTLRALEIRETLRDHSFQGSLLHTVRRTVTKSGARLLSQRLTSPSMSFDEINSRLDLVSELLENELLHENLRVMLRDTFDSLRLVQRFSFGKGDADDLLSVSRTIQVTERIFQTLRQHADYRDRQAAEQQDAVVASRRRRFEGLLQRLSLEGPSRLSTRILNAIDEEKLMEVHRIEDSEAAAMVELAEAQIDEDGEPVKLKGVARSVRTQANNSATGTGDESSKDGWIMQRDASSTLQRLHQNLDVLKEEQHALEANLRSRVASNNVSLRWTPGLGHILHVKGGAKEKMAIASLTSARSVKASKTTQSFHLPEWTQLGNRMEEARARIQGEENRIFSDLRAQVVRNLVELRRNAGVLDELDVACSFATLAREQRLVRPILNNGTNLNIVGGRHPTVENGLTKQGRNFTTNDLQMSDAERVLLITGPNMGGKSTFLRQNALISILAQTGSYVPAEYAEIGIVDKIFSRVGSADNLYEDQSTFMVEMLETAEILKQATPRSFVIMDEVGRGTTPEDGVAVGFATLHHLFHANRSRVLFATHFHALTDMVKGVEGIACYCTDVVEDERDGSWMFLHKLRRGVNRDSHALKVARLAGLPDEAVNVAATVLGRLHNLPPLPERALPRIAEAVPS